MGKFLLVMVTFIILFSHRAFSQLSKSDLTSASEPVESLLPIVSLLTWMPSWASASSLSTAIQPSGAVSSTPTASPISIHSPTATALHIWTKPSSSAILATGSPTSSVKPTTISPTEVLPSLVASSTATPPPTEQGPIDKPNASISMPLVWVIFGPIDLNNGKPVFGPINLPPFTFSANINNAPLPEKHRSVYPLEGSFSVNYPFHN